MSAIQGKAAVAAAFNNITIFKDANSADDLEEADMARDLFGSGGAHKPNAYDFGNGEVFDCSGMKA